MKQWPPSSQEIGVFNTKTHLSELLDLVERGGVFFITKRGRRIAELRPISSSKPPLTRGCAKNSAYWMAEDFDETPEDFSDYV